MKRAASRLPIWSCSRWGFPCPGDCSTGGGLLPHLFTLAPASLAAGRGGLFSVALSVEKHIGFPPACAPASMDRVTRHRALRSSDFPPPACAGSDSPPSRNHRYIRPVRAEDNSHPCQSSGSRVEACPGTMAVDKETPLPRMVVPPCHGMSYIGSANNIARESKRVVLQAKIFSKMLALNWLRCIYFSQQPEP